MCQTNVSLQTHHCCVLEYICVRQMCHYKLIIVVFSNIYVLDKYVIKTSSFLVFLNIYVLDKCVITNSSLLVSRIYMCQTIVSLQTHHCCFLEYICVRQICHYKHHHCCFLEYICVRQMCHQNIIIVVFLNIYVLDKYVIKTSSLLLSRIYMCQTNVSLQHHHCCFLEYIYVRQMCHYKLIIVVFSNIYVLDKCFMTQSSLLFSRIYMC